jgi:hypothetical protein
LAESWHEDNEIADRDKGSKGHFHVPNGTTIDRRQFLRFNYSIFNLISNRGTGLLHPAPYRPRSIRDRLASAQRKVVRSSAGTTRSLRTHLFLGQRRTWRPAARHQYRAPAGSRHRL